MLDDEVSLLNGISALERLRLDQLEVRVGNVHRRNVSLDRRDVRVEVLVGRSESQRERRTKGALDISDRLVVGCREHCIRLH